MHTARRMMLLVPLLVSALAHAAEPVLLPSDGFSQALESAPATSGQRSAGNAMMAVGGAGLVGGLLMSTLGGFMAAVAPVAGLTSAASGGFSSSSVSGGSALASKGFDTGTSLMGVGLGVAAVGTLLATVGAVTSATAPPPPPSPQVLAAQRRADEDLARRVQEYRRQKAESEDAAAHIMATPAAAPTTPDPASTPAPVGSMRSHTKPPLKAQADAPVR